MRLILLEFLFHWKDQFPVGGGPVYSQMVKKQVSPIQPIECYVRLTREWSTSSRSRDQHGIFSMNKERVCVKGGDLACGYGPLSTHYVDIRKSTLARGSRWDYKPLQF